jgi:hypothetical protein
LGLAGVLERWRRCGEELERASAMIWESASSITILAANVTRFDLALTDLRLQELVERERPLTAGTPIGSSSNGLRNAAAICCQGGVQSTTSAVALAHRGLCGRDDRPADLNPVQKANHALCEKEGGLQCRSRSNR